MPKFRVSVSYHIKTYETYEVEMLREDYDSDKDYQEALAEFKESPYDFCCTATQTDEETGDIVDGSWDEHYEEINALEQIVTALTDCDDAHCIDGTASDGRKDDGSKWEEGPFGDCEHCDGTGKVAIPVGDNKA